MTAACSRLAEHSPPAAGCDCGIYAERTAEDARERVRRHQAQVRTNFALAGLSRPPRPSYVVGAVELADAVTFVPRAGMIRIGTYELRGASARIVELHIVAGHGWPQLGDRLAQRYGVVCTCN